MNPTTLCSALPTHVYTHILIGWPELLEYGRRVQWKEWVVENFSYFLKASGGKEWITNYPESLGNSWRLQCYGMIENRAT